MTGVLSGIRVVELGTFITGPCASMLLADQGADIVKVEQPGIGDPFRNYRGELYSPQFRAFNARKRSVTLNLKEPRAKEVLERLLASADVLIENYRPGVLDKLGFGWERLHATYPRLVYCSINGFGGSGPYVDRPCYDAVAQAVSGFMSQNLDPAEPRIVGPAVADGLTGIFAAYGILGALVERGGTGKGRRVEVAMLDSLIAFGTEAFAIYKATGKVLDRTSRPSVSQSYALRCGDGKLIALHLAAIDKFFQALAGAVGRPELASDPRFVSKDKRTANYDQLAAELQAIFGGHPRDHWIALLTEHDVPHAPVSTVDEVCVDPQVVHNGIFRTMQHPTQGEVANIASPVLYDGERYAADVPPPMLGEHNDAVLKELGYDGAAVDAMRRDKII